MVEFIHGERHLDHATLGLLTPLVMRNVMNAHARRVLRELVQGRSVAALGSLDEGHPFVSMVPFALAPDGRALVVHVSRLAAHTGNMRRDGRVSVLVMEPEGSDKMPQSLARVTIQGEARVVEPMHPEYGAARGAYLGRFPDAAGLFELPDFSLFLIEVTSARLVGGFAQATTLSPEQFASALASEADRGEGDG
jgi:putative heme iron utilization protein